MHIRSKNHGFTIVELLIVVVVIAILAAITIVAYNGIQQRARTSAAQSELSSAIKKLEAYRYNGISNERYPADLATADVKSSNNVTFNYYPNVTSNAYCLEAVSGTLTYVTTSLTKSSDTGTCSVTNGLVGWWKLNGNTADSAGTNNATAVGSAPTTGQNQQANTAYSFNGSNQHMTSGTTNFPFDAASRSVFAWVNLASYPSTFRMVHSYGSTVATKASALSINSAGRVTFNSQSNDFSSNFTLALNEWHHIGYSISGNQVTIYYDGQSQTATISALTTATNAHYIGAWLSTNTNLWSGFIDDLRLYNRALSAGEVNSLYSAGAQ